MVTLISEECATPDNLTAKIKELFAGALELILEKRQTRTEDIETRILAMYSKGMSTRDIEDHLRDIYGVDTSASLISRITDKIMPKVIEWQSRPLEELYPVIFFDGIHFKVKKDSKIINKRVYSVLGIDMDIKKEILGIWIGENASKIV